MGVTIDIYCRMKIDFFQFTQNKIKAVSPLSLCLRCYSYSTLFNGFQYSVKKKRRNDQLLATSNDVLDFPSHRKGFFMFNFSSSYSNLSRAMVSTTKLLKPDRFSSNFNPSAISHTESESLICRKLNDDSHIKRTLINKINDALGHSNTTRESSKFISSNVDSMEAPTLEKKILNLLDSWEIDNAIKLLTDSVADGANPDRTVVYNMLLQIAELGKVETLLGLYETVRSEKNLVSSEKFYQCLGLAIYTSGQVAQGMDILKQKYEAGLSPADVDIFFTILATMIIKEFAHHYHLVEDFVDFVLTGDPPMLPARAMLWKCFVFVEKFDKADELRSSHEEIKKLIPAQASSIVQSSSPSSYINFDRAAVLRWLIQQTYLKMGLRASALHMLVQLKCDENEWSQVFQDITLAMENGVEPHQETLVNFLSTFFDECSDDGQLVFWKSVSDRLKGMEFDGDEGIKKDGE